MNTRGRLVKLLGVVLAGLAAGEARASSPLFMIPSASRACAAGSALIPAGEYVVDGVTRKVSAFCLDVHEVTTADYAACIAAGKCNDASLATCGIASTWKGVGDQHPLNCVVYAQAEAFCAFRGERLPTNAEWAWAARGGPHAWRFPWGDELPSDARACWSGNAHRVLTCDVMSAPPDPFGVYDLSGSVWEITAREGDGYIYRGGSFGTDEDALMAADYECPVGMEQREEYLGFRCARDRP